MFLTHPATSQWADPDGGPLYPVARTFRSFTITAPTFLRTQFDLDAAKKAILMKYVSQSGCNSI
ncbi:hypothetical protein GCM10007108_09680 [Thermogymnomonas acidicola]|uniref:Uncharacterized protein n=1 Tax=Thermogymnomonas acidicola TaxID=399579 RepID=A0AA37BS52_9ARCH|nr:hypothetical protein GCM10007108_09680 [Thermogymnomonas acidicola]